MNTMDVLKQTAQDFIHQLDQGDFAGASRRLDSTLAQALPEPKVKATWLQLIGQAGPFQAISTSQAAESGDKRMITVTCQFEKTALDFRFVFDQSGLVSGLNIQPVQAAVPYNPPAYVHPASFHDVEVIVGGGEWALPGTLSLPGGPGPFPAVVLVHGSGPQDRDETIGPNKPFRDLAGGLASQGIAVLRYEKRTKAHALEFTPELIARLTVQDEVIDDALFAVRLLRQTAGIDPGRIFVLGHSLGATLAPRIGQQDPAIAGLVIMAGLTRPLEDTILDQYTYIYSLSGALTDGHARQGHGGGHHADDDARADDLRLPFEPQGESHNQRVEARGDAQHNQRPPARRVGGLVSVRLERMLCPFGRGARVRLQRFVEHLRADGEDQGGRHVLAIGRQHAGELPSQQAARDGHEELKQPHVPGHAEFLPRPVPFHPTARADAHGVHAEAECDED